MSLNKIQQWILACVRQNPTKDDTNGTDSQNNKTVYRCATIFSSRLCNRNRTVAVQLACQLKFIRYSACLYVLTLFTDYTQGNAIAYSLADTATLGNCTVMIHMDFVTSSWPAMSSTRNTLPRNEPIRDKVVS